MKFALICCCFLLSFFSYGQENLVDAFSVDLSCEACNYLQNADSTSLIAHEGRVLKPKKQDIDFFKKVNLILKADRLSALPSSIVFESIPYSSSDLLKTSNAYLGGKGLFEGWINVVSYKEEILETTFVFSMMQLQKEKYSILCQSYMYDYSSEYDSFLLGVKDYVFFGQKYLMQFKEYYDFPLLVDSMYPSFEEYFQPYYTLSKSSNIEQMYASNNGLFYTNLEFIKFDGLSRYINDFLNPVSTYIPRVGLLPTVFKNKDDDMTGASLFKIFSSLLYLKEYDYILMLLKSYSSETRMFAAEAVEYLMRYEGFEISKDVQLSLNQIQSNEGLRFSRGHSDCETYCIIYHDSVKSNREDDRIYYYYNLLLSSYE